MLLQYADGKPRAEVGWGAPEWTRSGRRFPCTTRSSTCSSGPRTSRAGRDRRFSRGAASAVTGRPLGGLPAPDPVVRDARVVAYVGHDDNLANLGGLLGAKWSLPGYPENETPPAGALLFERRRAANVPTSGGEDIFVSFVSESLEQMRDAVPLTPSAPPIRTPIRIPGCSRDEPGYPCRVADFAQLVTRAIEADCVDRAP